MELLHGSLSSGIFPARNAKDMHGHRDGDGEQHQSKPELIGRDNGKGGVSDAAPEECQRHDDMTERQPTPLPVVTQISPEKPVFMQPSMQTRGTARKARRREQQKRSGRQDRNERADNPESDTDQAEADQK